MEQRVLPSEENNSALETSHSLLSETGQGPERLLHTAGSSLEIEPVEVLGGRLRRLVNQNQKRVRRAIWSLPATYTVAAVVLLLGKVLLGDERLMIWLTSPLLYLPALALWAGITSFMIGSILAPRKQCRQTARTLADLNDVRVVGPLVESLKVDDAELHRIAKVALADLLPRLRFDDGDLLKAEHRALLRVHLSRRPNQFVQDAGGLPQAANNTTVAFRIAILQAFAQVGDRRALPIVEQLAREEAKTDGEKRIQATAQECLPLLKLRIEQARDPQTLLRPATSDTGAETLLRPATGSRETPPDQLLRPSLPL